MNLKTRLFFSSLFLLMISATLFAQPELDVTPPDLKFDSVAVGDNSILSFQITNTDTAVDVIITNFAFEGDNPTQFSFPTTPDTITLTPGETSSPIDVQFAPTSFGNKFARINIEYNNGLTHEVILSGIGTAPDITASPNPLDFGPVILNSESVEAVYLKNVGNSVLAISDLQISGTNSSLFTFVAPPTLPDSIVAGDSSAVRIRFRPTSPGPKTADLVVENNDPDENNFVG